MITYDKLIDYLENWKGESIKFQQQHSANISEPHEERMKELGADLSGAIIFKLIDENGKLLVGKESTVSDSKVSLNVAEIPTGKYYLHILYNEGLISEEILING